MNVIFGFASYKDNSFELIVRNQEYETILKGQLKEGQLEIVDKILPTCAFIPTTDLLKAVEEVLIWAEGWVTEKRTEMREMHSRLQRDRQISWQAGTRGDLQPYAYLEENIKRDEINFDKWREPLTKLNEIMK